MSVKVKICGLTRLEEVDFANKLLPDYVGFIFAERSRRRISLKTAEEFKRSLHSSISAVGVFVNAPASEVVNCVKQKIIDVVQLHGAENPEYVSSLKNLLGDVTIIKAHRVDSCGDCRSANESNADFVLLDNGNGGTGQAFNWDFVSEIKRPYFLAGGLSPENIGIALSRLKPYCVDVSSGVETNGVKDFHKMESVVKLVRDVK